MLFTKESLSRLFNDSKSPSSNKLGLKNVCKKLKIDYPFLGDKLPSLAPLAVVQANSNPNSHNYPTGVPILVLLRNLDVGEKVFGTGADGSCTCKGIYIRAGNLILGNWLPRLEFMTVLSPTAFLNNMAPNTIYSFERGGDVIRANTAHKLAELLTTVLTAYTVKKEASHVVQ